MFLRIQADSCHWEIEKTAATKSGSTKGGRKFYYIDSKTYRKRQESRFRSAHFSTLPHSGQQTRTSSPRLLGEWDLPDLPSKSSKLFQEPQLSGRLMIDENSTTKIFEWLADVTEKDLNEKASSHAFEHTIESHTGYRPAAFNEKLPKLEKDPELRRRQFSKQPRSINEQTKDPDQESNLDSLSRNKTPQNRLSPYEVWGRSTKDDPRGTNLWKDKEELTEESDYQQRLIELEQSKGKAL